MIMLKQIRLTQLRLEGKHEQNKDGIHPRHLASKMQKLALEKERHDLVAVI